MQDATPKIKANRLHFSLIDDIWRGNIVFFASAIGKLALTKLNNLSLNTDNLKIGPPIRPSFFKNQVGIYPPITDCGQNKSADSYQSGNCQSCGSSYIATIKTESA
jgi:hypothetical protein